MSNNKFTIKGYSHNGVSLNLSGYRDADECVITRVTAADSQIDIIEIFEIDELCRMADCVEARLDRKDREANEAARVERHLWNREFAIA